MTMLKVTTFGCDPEVFLKDSSGKIKSAIGLFGGSKEKPRPLKTLGDGYAVQEDNILMEFNIPPAKTTKEFTDSVQKTLDLLSKRAARHGLSFANESAYSVAPEELEHPRAKVFGCDPDFNAYTGLKNPMPRAEDRCLRSAGGHIAFGFNIWDTPALHNKVLFDNKKHIDEFLVREMDRFLAIPAILLDDGIKRKQLYGCAGAHRPKPFGVEYRTLSNFWIFKPEVVSAMLKDFKMDLENKYSFENIIAYVNSDYYVNIHEMNEIAINTNDKEYAKWYLKKYRYDHPNISSFCV